MIIDAQTVERAQHLAEQAQHSDPQDTLDYFRQWFTDDPADGAVMAYLFAMTARFDRNLVDLTFLVNVPEEVRKQAERQAHAAYARGERQEPVMRGEAAYQRRKKAASRQRRQHACINVDELLAGSQAGDVLAHARRGLPAPAERRPIRESGGMSMAVAAGYCGAGASSLAKWERGVREPTGDRLIRYGELLRRLQSGSSTDSEGRAA